ncbi:MAG: hypothetical protein ABIH23_17615 [bacterium]
MVNFPLAKSCILGMLCVTLGALLLTVWNVGTGIEEISIAQAQTKLEQLEVPVLLQKGLPSKECDRIAATLSAIPKVSSATWQLAIPAWTGPAEASEGWESLWRSRLSPRVSIHLEADLQDPPYLPKLASQIQSVSGVAEVLTPETEWDLFRSIQHQAYVAGWLSRATAVVGGSVLTVIILLLMTSVGQWPWHVSPRFVRSTASAVGGIWAIIVSVWLGSLLTPAEMTGQPSGTILLSFLVGIGIPNLLLPRGYEKPRKSAVRERSSENDYGNTESY